MENHQLVDDFLYWALYRRGLSKSTIEAYTHTLKHYLVFLGDRPMATIRPDDVEDFGHRPRREGARPSPFTVRREIVTVRRLHAWAAERELGDVRTVSTACTPLTSERMPKPVPDDVWVALWESPLEDVDRLWLGLGYFLGLRRIEIVTVAPTAFNPNVGEMWFQRKGGSIYPLEYLGLLQAVERNLPHLCVGLSRFVDILHETATFRAGRGYPTLWFDTTDSARLDANRLNKRMSRVLREAGIPEKAVTPHRLRHSCATNLLRSGMDVDVIQDAMSHSSSDMTKRYTKVSGQVARWNREQEEDHVRASRYP